MVSLGEIYKHLAQVNENMEQMRGDIINLITVTNALKTSVDETNNILKEGFKNISCSIQNTNNTLNAGFKNISYGTQNIITLQSLAVQELSHLSKQNEAIVFILDNISKQSYELLREAHTQTGSQKSVTESIGIIRELYKSAHPDISLEVELLECCSREEPEPFCTYKPCEIPKKSDEAPSVNYEVFKPVSDMDI